jgi:hypothetical protein
VSAPDKPDAVDVAEAILSAFGAGVLCAVAAAHELLGLPEAECEAVRRAAHESFADTARRKLAEYRAERPVH